MVTEFRQMVFSSSELLNAIATFHKQKASQLPAGNIVECEIVEEPSIGARIRVADVDDSSKGDDVVLEASYVAAALIHYCVQNKIPLPRSAKKKLQRVGDGLALNFSMNADLQPVDDVGDEI